VPLSPPPLVRVLVQVRFSQVFAIADEAFIGPFQQDIIDRFPKARTEMEFVLGGAGPGDVPPTATPSRLWKFQSLDEDWTVTLGSGFVALETARYPGHEAFFAALAQVLAATAQRVRPPLVERLGVRYTQRLDAPADLANLDALVRPELIGVSTLADSSAQVQLALTQAQFALPDATLSARWGIIPPGATFDPTLQPLDRASWVLDIDTYDEQHGQFDSDKLVERAFEFSRRQYRFFRWAVTPAFLLRFGADPAAVAAIEDDQ
jgi:uncharacterized protein (TIGR04255 family)